MFGVKVPFYWFSVPENLRIEARPDYIEFYEKFSKETTENRIQRIGATIVFSLLAIYFFVEWQQRKANSVTPPMFGDLGFIPVGIFLSIAILLNLRRRIKLIVFDFSEYKVKLKPVRFSFIGSKSASMSCPFNLIIKKKTRVRHRSDENGSWTTYYEGYEIMVKLEKRGHDSIMFLETDDIKQDYGELIGKLAAVAGIDDPLLEME